MVEHLKSVGQRRHGGLLTKVNAIPNPGGSSRPRSVQKPIRRSSLLVVGILWSKNQQISSTVSCQIDIQLPISDVDGMPTSFRPWTIVLAVLSESIRKEQEKVIEYLQLENQILREKLGGKRVLLSDDQRRRLGSEGQSSREKAAWKDRNDCSS